MYNDTRPASSLRRLKWALKQTHATARPTRLYETMAQELGFASYAALTAALHVGEARVPPLGDFDASACAARIARSQSSAVTASAATSSASADTKVADVAAALDDLVEGLRVQVAKASSAVALATALDAALLPRSRFSPRRSGLNIAAGPIDEGDLPLIVERVELGLKAAGRSRMWLCGVEFSFGDIRAPDMLLPGIAAALNGFGGEAITFAFAPDPEALFGCRCVAGNAPDRARLDVAIQALAHLASRSDADSLCLDAIVPMLRNGLERGGMDTAIVTEALDCIDVRVALRD